MTLSPVFQRITVLTDLAMQGRRAYTQTWLNRELSAIVENTQNRHGKAGQYRAVSENYLKLLVNYTGETPPPGSSLRCVPVSLHDGGDGETLDAIAVRISG